MAENQSNCPETEEDDKSWREGICPYFQRDRGRGHVYCEGCVFRFPDIKARREFVYAFCAHPAGFKVCPLKQVMDRYYDRRFDRSETREPPVPCPPLPPMKVTHRKHRKHKRKEEVKHEKED